MVRRIDEGYEYTDLLDAIQDTVIDNFPDFNVHIARGKYPFVSVDVTKNANRNIVGRPRDRFVIRPEANGKITLTCDTCNGYDAEILDLQGIVNYFNDYLSDFTAVESIKRNKRRMKEGLPVYLKGDNDDKSRFLSRFISDVKYWISLGKTPEADKFLWAGTPEEQAQVIQDTFDAITDQADRVLTQDDIDYYVGQLLNRYDESVKRGSRKRRNKRC